MLGILDRLLSCTRPSSQAIFLKDENGEFSSVPLRNESCEFCNVSVSRGFKIVYEDELCVAFHDIFPAARYHIQVVPKKHIESVRSLAQSDIELVHHMKGIGNRLLDERDIEQHMRRMGFHIPPFNSIYHLHLHVQALPYTSSLKAAKYPIKKGSGSNNKGFSWFVGADQTIRILENDRQIGFLPC